MFPERLVPYMITLNNLIGKINRTKKTQKRKVKHGKERQRRDWKGHKLRRGEGKQRLKKRKRWRKRRLDSLVREKEKVVQAESVEWNHRVQEKSEKKCKGRENYQTSYLKQLSYESCKCEVLHKFSWVTSKVKKASLLILVISLV